MPGGARFGVLTYCSFDDGGGLGGWRVKQQIELDGSETAALLAATSTEFDPGVVPAFPTSEDLQRLPRRFSYLPIGDAVAYWHTAPAGNDATGRPGNIMAHIVLDRSPDMADCRPIELWRSPDWLTPYGAEEVARAWLDSATLPTPGRLSREAVVDFVLDLEEYRVGVFSVLLDACSATFQRQGPPVVLGCEDSDHAAAWVAALTTAMMLQHARRFFFSVWERSWSLDQALARGAMLVCVPLDDLAALRRRTDLVMLTESESVQIGDLYGTRHRLASGAEVSTSELSAMAQVMWLEPAETMRSLELVDQLSVDLSAGGPDPAFGAAMTVAARPEVLADAGAEAARVVVRSSPSSLTRHEVWLRRAEDLVAGQAGSTPAEAWALLSNRRIRDAGPMDRMLAERYLSEAARDVAWLATVGGVPLPPALELGPDGRGRVACSVCAGLETVTQVEDPWQRAIVVGALAQISAFAGLSADDPSDESVGTVADAVADQLDSAVIPWLLSKDAESLINALGVFSEATQSRLIRPGLAGNEHLHRPSPPGQRLSPAVTAWLYPDGADPVVIGPTFSVDEDPVRLELAAHRWQTGDLAERLPFAYAMLAEEQRSPELRLDVESVFTSGAWDPAELLVLLKRFTTVAPYWLVPTLLGAPSGPDLSEICQRLLASARRPMYRDDVLPPDLEALVAVRLEDPSWSRYTNPQRSRLLQRFLRAASLAQQASAVLDHGLRDQLLVATVLETVNPGLAMVGGYHDGFGFDPHDALLRAIELLGPRDSISQVLQQQLADALRDSTLERLAFLAVREQLPIDEVYLPEPGADWLKKQQVGFGRTEALLDRLLRDELRRDPARRRELPGEVGRWLAASHPELQRQERRIRRVVDDRIKDLFSDARTGGGTRIGSVFQPRVDR